MRELWNPKTLNPKTRNTDPNPCSCSCSCWCRMCCREEGRPLFVTMMIYLNETWPDDFHAETLLLDPESQTGIFVRPSPGRIVLMVGFGEGGAKRCVLMHTHA